MTVACTVDYGRAGETSTTISSPNGDIVVEVGLVETESGTQLLYKADYKEQPLVVESAIRFELSGGKMVGQHLEDLSITEVSVRNESWKPLYGERATVRDHCNALQLSCRDSKAHSSMNLEFRCYDTGFAFRTQLGDAGAGDMVIQRELSEFRFAEDPLVWRTTNAQGVYDQVRLSAMGKEVERPLVIKMEGEKYVAIAEAKLVDYARTNLQSLSGGECGAVTQIEGQVRAAAPVTTPWRVVMVGDSPGELLENNDILLNLNDPCAIADTSWIKPGKVIREITLTTKGGKACIDFAAKYNFSYVEFDAGWYGHEYDDASDATTVTLDPKRSAGPFDLHELIDYATERDIGIIVYVNRRALERQLDEILPLYKEWGIKGVKYGFVKVGSQEATSWLHEAVRKAADHQLLVDIHDEYRPTGYSRTYPNLMTQEGVRGDEATPPTEQTLTTLFTRSIAGAADFTVCYFAERVDDHWSHAHQLAKPICFYSPWHFLFWYDTPLSSQQSPKLLDSIIDTPELAFFASVPTTWDETRVLHGTIGEYAVVARRSGANWFIGAMNDGIPRKLTISLDFLDKSQRYQATIYRDDPQLQTRTKVAIDRQEVDSAISIDIEMIANGGQAMIITPAQANRNADGAE